MNEEVIEFLRHHKRPFATAGEIADSMGVNNSAIHKRLDELEREGMVESQNVGSSAKVIWLPERDVTLID